MFSLSKAENTGKLIIFFLVILFVFKLPFSVLPWGGNWFDETIVDRISQLRAETFIETIKSEPHPPGFFFLVKLLSPLRFPFKKIILLLLCYFMYLKVIQYGLANKVIQKFKLSSGLILYFGSFGFMMISGKLKQDLVSFPLFLLFFFSVLNIFHKLPKTKSLRYSNADTLDKFDSSCSLLPRCPSGYSRILE